MQKEQAVENSISTNTSTSISNHIISLNTQKHQCKSCLEDIDFQVYTMPCKCFICGDCCLQYLLVQIDHIDFYIDKDIKCPNDHCKKVFKVSQFREHNTNKQDFQIPQISLLDEKLLIKHLQNDPQARNCPNLKCNYYGILPDNIKQCKEEKFQCESCMGEWSDIMIQNQSQTILQKIQKFWVKKNELFSEVHKLIMAKQCPRCAIPITKYGGCYHMICRKCNFEFCWYCCQQYQSHSVYKCALQIAMRNSYYFILALLLTYFSGLHKLLFQIMIVTVTFIISAILQNILLAFFYLFASFFLEVIKIHCKIQRQGYDRSLLDQKKKNFHLSILTGGIFLLYLSLILYFYYTASQILKFIFLECITFTTLYISYNSMCFIWETWMRYIY